MSMSMSIKVNNQNKFVNSAPSSIPKAPLAEVASPSINIITSSLTRAQHRYHITRASHHTCTYTHTYDTWPAQPDQIKSGQIKSNNITIESNQGKPNQNHTIRSRNKYRRSYCHEYIYTKYILCVFCCMMSCLFSDLILILNPPLRAI